MKNTYILTGIVVAVLIGINGFVLIGESIEPDGVSYYESMRDSIVDQIHNFHQFSETSMTRLTRFDQESGYRHIGHTNFLRSEMLEQGRSLKQLMLQWQASSEDGWTSDSLVIMHEYNRVNSEIEDVEHDLRSFFSVR